MKSYFTMIHVSHVRHRAYKTLLKTNNRFLNRYDLLIYIDISCSYYYVKIYSYFCFGISIKFLFVDVVLFSSITSTEQWQES